ncbi:MAG: hypothetical protein ACK5W2_02755 [bacterium]
MTRTSAVALALLAGTCSAIAAPRETFTYTNPATGDTLNVFGATAASTTNGVVVPFTLDGYTTKGVRVTGTLTTVDPASFGNQVRMSVFAPGTPSPILVTTVPINGIGASGTFGVNFAWAGTASAPFPFGMPQTPGNWTITFWDATQNAPAGSPDAQITNLQISMDDDLSPAAVATTLDMTSASGSIQHNFELGSPVKWYRITVPAASLNIAPPSYFEIFTGGPNTVLADSELSLWRTQDAFNGALTPAAQQQPGARFALDFGDGDDNQAALSFGVGSGLPLGTTNAVIGVGADGILTAGDYYLAVVAGGHGYFPRTWALFPTSLTPADGNVDINWRSGTRVVPPPTTEANLGTLVANTTVAQTVSVTADDVTAGNRVKWLRFTLPQTVGVWPNIRSLTIDTEGSQTVGGTFGTTPTRQTFVALFAADGLRVASDFNDGSDTLGTLTFGTDDRPGALSSLTPTDTSTAGGIINGRDSDNLPPGEYYIGVGVGDNSVIISPGAFLVSTTESGTGTIRVNVNYTDPFVPTVTAVPAPNAAESISINDLGDVATTTPGTEKVSSVTVDVAAGTGTTFLTPQNVDWVKFTIPQPTTADPSYYVDIDTFGGNLPAVGSGIGSFPANDTEISLWRNDGLIIARNDDFNGNTVLSGLSFGSNTPRNFPDSGVGTFTGAQGSLPAGTYWIAAAPWNIVSGMQTINDVGIGLNGETFPRTSSPTLDTRFRVSRTSSPTGVINFNVPAGTIQVNVRTNIPAPNPCPNPSNVSGPGQNTTAIDGELTADDIIVFLNRFFQGC